MDCDCCQWRSDPNGPTAESRRRFLKKVFAGVASFGLAGGWSESSAERKPPQPVGETPAGEDYPVTRPRVYEGKHLEAVAMPIGGIGTGTIWLDGQGVLRVWQIFNNYTEVRVPGSFFAVRARPRGGEPVVRVLQTAAEPGFPAMAALSYEGGYPIARLRFRDAGLPVNVFLEAFNPLIPTDTDNSSLPCAIFRITAENRWNAPVEVSVLGSLQNAVGGRGRPGVQGVSGPGYGRNRNIVVREREMTAIDMHGLGVPPPSGKLKVRESSGAEVEGPELLWVSELGGGADGRGLSEAEFFAQAAHMAQHGGGIVVCGLKPALFERLRAVRERRQAAGLVVFEDFEKDSYEGWTVKGTAFGSAPHTGASRGQQPVTGFIGRRLVNTFLPNDRARGELISRPFTIEKKYIGFLIGGGNHPGKTCINLRVDGKVVRTATGRNNERLEPASWDVSEFLGKQATIEIVDRYTGGWGHINVDHIVFSEEKPDELLKVLGPLGEVAELLDIRFDGAEKAHAGGEAAPTEAARCLEGITERWAVGEYTRLRGLRLGEGYEVWATAPNGEPLIVAGPLGKAKVVLCLAGGLPWSWAARLLAAARGVPLGEGQRIVSGSPAFGTMALATPDEGATATAKWTDGEALGEEFRAAGKVSGERDSGESPPGKTYNAALAVPFVLQPGEKRTCTFVIAWHFPNVERFGHKGNYYSRLFPDALSVARYVCQNIRALWERTELYHRTVYQSNLPEEFLDAMTSQSVIFRGPTCWRSEAGYFAGYEGSYRCCPLNCTHVWNYAQSHARLFPEIGRNLRKSDLLVYLHEDGETSHRQHKPTGAFFDGHAAVIVATLREHQLSPDRSFLEQVWPNLKKAMDWMIEHLDPDHDGVPQGLQPNTYDCKVSGANTFIGSQYLCALAAAERMAEIMGERDTAARWRKIREAGMKNQNAKLWNGEYYIQLPERVEGQPPGLDYNTGCHSDQLLGQWWAHQLNLGYLYPRERVRSALAAIVKYNLRKNFRGFTQRPRRYVIDSEGGLLMCTWPHGGRPDPFIRYADEVWTGIEYAVAGALVYEGMIDEARRIVATARGRYDGVLREGLNSGPGGNPFNELECGKFYARAMSSWALLLASQGQVLDGPAGIIGFKPRWRPHDHRSFFTGPECWGLFVQRRGQREQLERIEVRHGRLVVRELVFAVPEGARRLSAEVRVGGRPVRARVARNGAEVRLALRREAVVGEGSAVEVSLRW